MNNPKRIEKGMYWDRAWSLVGGCSKVSPGCENCWAEKEAHMRSSNPNDKVRARYEGLTKGGKFNGQLRLHTENLDLPLRVKKPTVWAVWNDLFHEDVPFEWVDRVINAAYSAPQHIYLILTKRPERMKLYFESCRERGIPAILWMRHGLKLWLGVTAENQEQADKRIPLLLQTPAAVRFLSCEPLLGPVNLQQIRDADALLFPLSGEFICDGINEPRPIKHGGINWIIAGGESGPGARPMHPDWARSLRDQCQAAGVPFFFKQFGEFREMRRYNSWHLERVGKKKAGRLLDGREWSEFPEVQP